MSGRLLLLAVIALAPSCGGNAVVTTSAGAILYWHAELSTLGRCEDADLIAALAPGAQQVQLLRYSSPTKVEAEPLAPAGGSCAQSPVQMATLDVDGDGTLDLVVSDSSCGNWYALQGPDCEMYPHTWADAFPPADPMPWMTASGSPPRLMLASDGSLAVFERPAAMSSWQPIRPEGSPPFSLVGQTTVSDIAFFVQDPSSQATAVVLQEGGGASLFTVSESPEATTTTLSTATPFDQQNVEYLRPFWALDQLKLLPDRNCPQQALALGLFQVDDGSIPHRLQRVRFDQGGYSTTEISQDAARSFAVRADQTGAVRMAVVTQGPGSDLIVGFGRLEDCSTLTIEASAALPTHRAAAPGENDGIVFVGAPGTEAVLSYDGTSATTCVNDAAGVTCASVIPALTKSR